MNYKKIGLLRHLVIALILSASTHLQVAANENKQSNTSYLDNLSSEYAVCSAYYTVIQAVLINAGDTHTAGKYSRQSEVAYQYASQYAKQGRTDGMAKEATLSRIQNHVQAMAVEIRDDANNISLLLNRHAYKCKEAMMKPEAFRKLFQIETQKID